MHLAVRSSSSGVTGTEDNGCNGMGVADEDIVWGVGSAKVHLQDSG